MAAKSQGDFFSLIFFTCIGTGNGTVYDIKKLKKGKKERKKERKKLDVVPVSYRSWEKKSGLFFATLIDVIYVIAHLGTEYGSCVSQGLCVHVSQGGLGLSWGTRK